jgi:peptide deformylase|nr:peptide deformylase [Neorhizobium tomejilense]
MKPSRSIVVYPDPVLRERCRELGGTSAETRDLAGELRASLSTTSGIGLAAPQIGEAVRMVLLKADASTRAGGGLIMINPVIVGHSHALSLMAEGCLSLPGQRHAITRPSEVSVEYISETGHARRVDLDGLAAKCAQHEIDHLDGILIIDRAAESKPQAAAPGSIVPTMGATIRATVSHFDRSR